VAALLLASLAAGACSTMVVTPLQPQVSRLEYRADVQFAGGSAVLSAAERQTLETFLATTAIGPDDRLYLLGTAPVGADPARAERLIDSRNQSVAALLKQRGFEPRPMPAGLLTRPVPVDAVAVIVVRDVVSLPACPNWSSWPNYSNFENQPGRNWSCATAVNFGMMVADPGDLVRGAVPGTADGTVMARSIERYRDGKTRPLMRDVSTAEAYASDSGGGGGQDNGGGGK
jgi:type IV pilus biogenesis protein CpaD/CtpE